MTHTGDLKKSSLKTYCLWYDLKEEVDDRSVKCLSSQREQHMKYWVWAIE